jgi:hypothetical protein
MLRPSCQFIALQKSVAESVASYGRVRIGLAGNGILLQEPDVFTKEEFGLPPSFGLAAVIGKDCVEAFQATAGVKSLHLKDRVYAHGQSASPMTP